jgi:hypothetical protein
MAVLNLPPADGGASRMRAMDQWKGAPKPTTPANKPVSTPAKPGQAQPSGMRSQASTTTKKPTGKK